LSAIISIPYEGRWTQYDILSRAYGDTMAYKEKRLFRILLLGIFLLQILGCASFQHGYTTRRYQGQWLEVAKVGKRPLPGNKRLKMEMDFDSALDIFVQSNGLPDYIYVIDRKSTELAYLKDDKIYSFKRPTMDVNSKIIRTYPVHQSGLQVRTDRFPDEKKTNIIPIQDMSSWQSWAVIIGISKYERSGRNNLTNLIFADDDAKAFANTLTTLGWSNSHIKLLVNEQATQRNILIALESWLTKVGPNDQIVLFWSGHGFPDPEDPEKIYFACYDTDIKIPATGYRMDRVRSTLEERKTKNVIVFADTCHAGKLITRGNRGISIIPNIEKMSRENKVPKGWIFMVGADTDRQAIEDTSWSNGAFTHSLIKGLNGEADGFQSAGAKDGIVTMGELKDYMNTAMPDETQKILGVAKRPVITTSTGDPDIWNLTLQAK